jgi:sigma-B regulation protein RsbQ
LGFRPRTIEPALEFGLSAAQRNNVVVSGRGAQAMIFAHGYGCDQNMWRFVAPPFADRYRIVLFDHVGHGRSDASAFDREKYATLDGYAGDVIEICDEFALKNTIFVGHSVRDADQAPGRPGARRPSGSA